MSGTAILGVDPGPTPGAVILHGSDSTWTVLDLAPQAAQLGLPTEGYVMSCIHLELASMVAIERFVIGPGTARKTPAGSLRAVAMAEGLCSAAVAQGLPVQYLPAGTVKPWASDRKLAKLGLLEATKGGGGHARDATRHALYMAVKRGLIDPEIFL